MDTIRQIRRQIVDCGKLLYERQYVGGAEGNISAKLERSKIAITPSGKCLGSLKSSDMVIISPKGKKLSGKLTPSSEYRLHFGIYEHRPDIKAICHTHPIYSTAWAVAGIALDKLILPEIIDSLGIIPLVEYGTPGTTELFDNMAELVGNHDAFLLRNHGAVTLGINLEDAFFKMEMVERYAAILFNAKMLGKPKPIPLNMAKKISGYKRIIKQQSYGKSGRRKRVK